MNFFFEMGSVSCEKVYRWFWRVCLGPELGNLWEVTEVNPGGPLFSGDTGENPTAPSSVR